MSKAENHASSKVVRNCASVINSLLKLTSDSFEISNLTTILTELNVVKMVDIDFASCLAAIAKSWAATKSSLNKPLIAINDSRKKIIGELMTCLDAFCKKIGVDLTLALVGIRLRQGDYFIIEDEASFLSMLLPTPIVRRYTMSLCGILTLPVSFQLKYGDYPETFTEGLSFESASMSLCSLLKINPFVPRLMALDENTLKLVESKFGFSRKAVILYLSSLIIDGLVCYHALQPPVVCFRRYCTTRT